MEQRKWHKKKLLCILFYCGISQLLDGSQDESFSAWLRYSLYENNDIYYIDKKNEKKEEVK